MVVTLCGSALAQQAAPLTETEEQMSSAEDAADLASTDAAENGVPGAEGAVDRPPIDGAAAEETEVGSGPVDESHGGDGAELTGDETPPANADESLSLEDQPLAEKNVAQDWGRFQPFADLIEAGGVIIIILALISVLALALIIVKQSQFIIQRVGDRGFVSRAAAMLRSGDGDGALEFLEKRRAVAARVMEAAVRGKLVH